MQFLSVAVIRYADACPPGVLHPDCPFARGPAERRTCDHECRDVILRLSKPGHALTFDIDEAQFDARQLLLSEASTVPECTWHTASLILRLASALSHPPTFPDGSPILLRTIRITNALAYLGQRGHDYEALVRDGFAHMLPTMITLWIAGHYQRQRAQQADDDPTGGWISRFEDLVGAITPEATSGHLLALALRKGFTTYVGQWMRSAPLESVISWSPWDPHESGDTPLDDDGRARWMVDRFGETSLKNWALTSLHHEHRYLRGAEPPVPITEMRQRKVSRLALDEEIANRSVEGRASNFPEVVTQALTLLNDGRRSEAAGLFDAVRILDSSHAHAHNNYGFCLLLDDPETALDALRISERLEQTSNPINRINQAAALMLTGRPTEALVMAERAFSERRHFPEVGWLWTDLDESCEPEIAETDPLPYLCRLGLRLAEQIDDEDEIELWKARCGEPT